MRARGTTLAELVVAFGIFSLMLVAVTSFYVEAIAVSSRRDDQSERLRRFHLGLDRMEMELLSAQVVGVQPHLVTFVPPTDLVELHGFPVYDSTPAQYLSRPDGVYRLHGSQSRVIVPLRQGEEVRFTRLPVHPDRNRFQILMSVELREMEREERDSLLFRRTLHLDI